MSVTVYWQQMATRHKHFANARHDNFEALKRVCGDVVGPEHVPQLRAMAVAQMTNFMMKLLISSNVSAR